MTRIEPDSCIHVSRILAAIKDLRLDWDEADDVPLDSEVSFRDRAYAQGVRDACDQLRAKLQPTEKEA